MENFSRMEVGLPSLTLLFLKETQHLQKGQTITSILLMLMVTNATDVVIIIFSLTVIDSNIPILAAMVYIEDMVGVVIAMVEEIVTMEESEMVPLAIAPVTDTMVSVNLWLLGNIFILFMKIQSWIFILQPGSSGFFCLLCYVQVWVL